MDIFATDYLRRQAECLSGQLVSIRRRLHACPELGTRETETGRLIMDCLKKWGVDFCFPVADTGIVASIQGKGPSSGSPGRVVALRADMDGLPLQEDKNRPFCSHRDGVMHACGHDAHMAVALGVARFLKNHEADWSGTVKFFFQPAEETCGGADRMVQEGCMENPKVDFVIGLHVMPDLEYGQIELRRLDLNAASDELDIRIHGVSSHCASPEESVDAIVMAAAVIQNLQTIISRNLSPFKPAVLSLGTIEGGSAHNIIADQVRIRGALRTTTPEARKLFHSRIRCIVEETCRAYGGRGQLVISPGYDALVNTPEIVEIVRETAALRLGEENIHFKEFPSLGVEDFSFFLNHAPGAFYHLGCGCRKKGITAPLHSPHFDLDERVLALGFELQAGVTGRLLRKR